MVVYEGKFLGWRPGEAPANRMHQFVRVSYRALSWSHDAWALIALLSAILVLGNIVLVLLIRITRAPRAQVFLKMLVMY